MNDKRIEMLEGIARLSSPIGEGGFVNADLLRETTAEIRRRGRMVDELLNVDPWDDGPCHWCFGHRVDGHKDYCEYQRVERARDWGE